MSTVVLADTSAWVEFDRATGSPADNRLAELLDADADLAVTEPVIMEVLAGARSEARHGDLVRLLARARLVPVVTVVDFEAAADVYRRCRRVGVTPRGLVDCMIAGIAWRTGASLLAHDVDLAHIARVIGLDMADGSLLVPR